MNADMNLNIYSLIGKFVKEDASIVYENVRLELNNNYQEYLEYTKGNDAIEIGTTMDIYNYLIPIVAAILYNINIGVNDKMHVYVDETQSISLYLYQPIAIEKKLITVFDDPLNYNCEHPLQTKWDVWIDNKENDLSDNWIDTIKKIISFDSIECFWQIYNNIPAPSALEFPSDYYIFRENIIPMWEDPFNKNGGKMTITLRKIKGCEYDYDLLDNLWMNTVLYNIGENFCTTSKINGMVLNIRKNQSRINLWTQSSDKQDVIKTGEQWKAMLTRDMNVPVYISFIKHDDVSVNYIIE